MAIYEVFSHNEVRRYKTHVCSKATLVQIFIIPITFIVPLIIAYATKGLWMQIDTFSEQPTVHFKHKLLVLLDTNAGYLTWSTYQQFNFLQMANLRTPMVSSREVDTNYDGKFDYLDFKLEMPLLDTERVLGAKVLLLFDYVLQTHSYFQMESMAYLHLVFPTGGSSLTATGSLNLKQRQSLASDGFDLRYNYSVINESSIYAEDYDFANIFQLYEERNITTSYQSDHPSWTTGRSAGQPFAINIRVNYPVEQRIAFTPGFWQEIENGWIQYLSILLIFLFVFDRVKIFIFQNQLVTTIVERPMLKNKTQ